LDWINFESYQVGDDYILFGRDNIYDLIDELTQTGQDEKTGRKAIHELVSDFKTHLGRVLASQRTSLGPAPKPKPRSAEALPPQEHQKWVALLAKISRPTPSRTTSRPSNDVLDAAYANEVVQKLEKIVQRASLLDPHEVASEEIGDSSIRAYFCEAHRCYLYGFNVACAVLCRAVLEAALKAKFYADHSIESSLSSNQSLFKKLSKRLGSESSDAAGTVKDCGDWAIHDFRRFQRECEGRGKLAENLLATRLILSTLYPRGTKP
jgi:hypothetical protein